MKKALFLSLALLAGATTVPARAETNLRIPTSVEVGGLLAAGTAAGAFSALTGYFAYHLAQEKSNGGGKPEQLFHRTLTIGSALAAVTSGIVSYMAFKNAYKLLK